MAKDKVKVQFKVLKQSADVGGKYYGLIDNSNPVNPTLTMQQIIDFKKLHNYSASQLSALIEDVLQGAAELVARDGQPRNLSSLLKFEARIRGTFANPEAAVTSQNVYVAPRMLKDIKVTLDKGDFEFSNTNDSTDPRIAAITQDYDGFERWGVDSWTDGEGGMPILFKGDLAVSGTRLAPSGWTEDCKFTCEVLRGSSLIPVAHLEKKVINEEVYGCFGDVPSLAALNALTFNRIKVDDTGFAGNAWRLSGGDIGDPEPTAYVPAVGDKLKFTFTRHLGSAGGEPVEVVKYYDLV